MGIHIYVQENEWKPAERYCSAKVGPVSFLVLYFINKDSIESLDPDLAFKVQSDLCEMAL